MKYLSASNHKHILETYVCIIKANLRWVQLERTLPVDCKFFRCSTTS